MAGASTLAWDQVLAEFQRIWGYSNFRPPQDAIIRALLEHRDLLVVLPTGGGKSICFQLPALLQSGLTLVVSPLLALMENQVQELQAKGLPAVTLHSELSPRRRHQILQALDQQQLRLLYLSPETLLSPPVWQRLARPQIQINGLILDEAHCLVQWGETFRPAYRRLGAARQALSHQRSTPIPVAAFTATADPQAQQTLVQVLQLRSPQRVCLNPHRPNLRLQVNTVFSPGQRHHLIRRYLERHPQQAGLIYVRTRRDSETLAQQLAPHYPTAPYHAGLGGAQRRQIESAWMADRLQFVVCTSAFGVGINKPNTRWVIHYQAPCTLSEYVQEVGRAGRDGELAEALTLVSEPTGWLDPSDRQRAHFFERQTLGLRHRAEQLVKQIPQTGEVAEVSQRFSHGAIALAWLHSTGQLEWIDPFRYRLRPAPARPPALQTGASQQMHRFLHSRQCRWQALLRAFGFTAEAHSLKACGHCDNC